MGSKKKEIALQVNINTQELWEEMLGSKGLTVVDVYQGWCGPCKPVVSLFQKMRIEAGLDLLHFALAEADCLDVLEKYRGKCEPTFLFYAGGELVAVVKGANAPLLRKTILHQLEVEKKVLAEGRERNVVPPSCQTKDHEFNAWALGEHPNYSKWTEGSPPSLMLISLLETPTLESLNDLAVTDEALSGAAKCPPQEKDGGDGGEDVDIGIVPSEKKACTLGIIKPDAVAHGKADEIIMKIQEAGFDILSNEERTLTEAEMQVFYQHRAGQEAFEKLVHHMCSGPSHLLILTKTEGTEDVVAAWRDFLGPCDPNVARREHPESLRAQYGTEMPFNAVHGSRDRDDANRELALLFPSFRFSDTDTEAPQGAEAQSSEPHGGPLHL